MVHRIRSSIANFNPTNGLRAIPTMTRRTKRPGHFISIPPTGLGQFRHDIVDGNKSGLSEISIPPTGLGQFRQNFFRCVKQMCQISIPPTGLGQFRLSDEKRLPFGLCNFNPTNGLRAIPTAIQQRAKSENWIFDDDGSEGNFRPKHVTALDAP